MAGVASDDRQTQLQQPNARPDELHAENGSGGASLLLDPYAGDYYIAIFG